MKNFIRIALAATLTMAPAALFAQTATTVTHHHRRTINQTSENQQDRIGQGVTNGTLSPAEAARLEHQEAGINKEEREMKAEDHGHLTKQDRRTLRNQQRHESRRIYNTRHDLHGHK